MERLLLNGADKEVKNKDGQTARATAMTAHPPQVQAALMLSGLPLGEADRLTAV